MWYDARTLTLLLDFANLSGTVKVTALSQTGQASAGNMHSYDVHVAHMCGSTPVDNHYIIISVHPRCCLFFGTFKTSRDFAAFSSRHESRASIEHGLITPGWREAHVLITHPQIRKTIAGLVSLNQPLRYGKWLGNPINNLGPMCLK